MMQRIAWRRDCHKIWKKARVELSLGTMGIESCCLLLVLCFWSFGALLCFIMVLFTSCAWPCHLGCGVIIEFHVLPLGSFLSFLLCFECFGNCFGKRKVNGDQGELCGT